MSRERWHEWEREIHNRHGDAYGPRLGVSLRRFLIGLFQ